MAEHKSYQYAPPGYTIPEIRAISITLVRYHAIKRGLDVEIMIAPDGIAILRELTEAHPDTIYADFYRNLSDNQWLQWYRDWDNARTPITIRSAIHWPRRF